MYTLCAAAIRFCNQIIAPLWNRKNRHQRSVGPSASSPEVMTARSKDTEAMQVDNQSSSVGDSNRPTPNTEEGHENEEKKKMGGPGTDVDKIEREFSDLKERFFADKIESLKKELDTLKNGTHQGFLKKCQELEEQQRQRLWAAERWRDYQIENINSIFAAEKQQGEDEYDNEKKSLQEKMINTVQEKKKKLLDEKTTAEEKNVNARTSQRKRNGKELKDGGSIKRKLNPPHILYTLREDEIKEDLAIIHKGHPYKNKAAQADVYAERGKLFLEGNSFEKGQHVKIESQTDNNVWKGIITFVSPAEIHLKGESGVQSRFTLTQLKSRRYVISTNGHEPSK
ncbi:suppressor of defective silencing 3-like [Planoprotostelium fungivorum]|uniref:Suppressor of defective silencing 3-like n=1 Tax=Planoprotostelium fungivorum TaxID=1890364 RepID=A0A2P6NFC7_9EUKA|nr:suppressor of defective silencing 3-like [Planoprotostelium fungivorum]